MENQVLRSLTRELDRKVSAMIPTVETLSDVEVLLGQLRDDMDVAVHQGEERAYYREHHRMVRILSRLTYYTTKDLCAQKEQIETVKERIFDIVVRNQDDK